MLLLRPWVWQHLPDYWHGHIKPQFHWQPMSVCHPNHVSGVSLRRVYILHTKEWEEGTVGRIQALQSFLRSFSHTGMNCKMCSTQQSYRAYDYSPTSVNVVMTVSAWPALISRQCHVFQGPLAVRGHCNRRIALWMKEDSHVIIHCQTEPVKYRKIPFCKCTRCSGNMVSPNFMKFEPKRWVLYQNSYIKGSIWVNRGVVFAKKKCLEYRVFITNLSLLTQNCLHDSDILGCSYS